MGPLNGLYCVEGHGVSALDVIWSHTLRRTLFLPNPSTLKASKIWWVDDGSAVHSKRRNRPSYPAIPFVDGNYVGEDCLASVRKPPGVTSGSDHLDRRDGL